MNERPLTGSQILDSLTNQQLISCLQERGATVLEAEAIGPATVIIIPKEE